MTQLIQPDRRLHSRIKLTALQQEANPHAIAHTYEHIKKQYREYHFNLAECLIY